MDYTFDALKYMPDSITNDIKVIIYLDKGLNIGFEIDLSNDMDKDSFFSAITNDCEFKKYLKCYQSIDELVKKNKAKYFKGSLSTILNDNGTTKPGSLILYPTRAGNFNLKDEVYSDIEFLNTKYAKK